MKQLTCYVLGYGERGKIYSSYSIKNPDLLKVDGVIELNYNKRMEAKEKHNLKDDNRLKDKIAYTMYKGKLKSAYDKYPKKAEFIKEQLEILYNLEQEKNTNIDLVSNTFGNLMSEIFAYKQDENENELRRIGFNIGKYIYLLDAYEDLDKDYKFEFTSL